MSEMLKRPASFLRRTIFFAVVFVIVVSMPALLFWWWDHLDKWLRVR